jgi:preprotein translocase subunit SecE
MRGNVAVAMFLGLMSVILYGIDYGIGCNGKRSM